MVWLRMGVPIMSLMGFGGDTTVAGTKGIIKLPEQAQPNRGSGRKKAKWDLPLQLEATCWVAP